MAGPPLTGCSKHRATRMHLSGKRAALAAFAKLCAATAPLSSAAMTAPLTVRLVGAGTQHIEAVPTAPVAGCPGELRHPHPTTSVLNGPEEIGQILDSASSPVPHCAGDGDGLTAVPPY